MSGLPAAYNIMIYQGQTLSLTFVWTTGTCGCTYPPTIPVGQIQTPVDLTGYTATMQFRAYAGGTLLIDVSQYITLGGTAGTIALLIPDNVTESFTWFAGFYDLFLTSSSQFATPLIAGTVTVTPSVST
jgi:hypothetical protein